MKTLIMDTATNLLIVGVINGNETTVVTRVGKNDNAAYLVNKIDEVLNKANLKLDDIDEIIVGIGPGSYTGIRVSVVVAKTLSYSKSIPLKQISSIAILTSGYEEEVVGAIDARRSEEHTSELQSRPHRVCRLLLEKKKKKKQKKKI